MENWTENIIVGLIGKTTQILLYNDGVIEKEVYSFEKNPDARNFCRTMEFR
jgi:hypothetical protein